MDETKTEQAPTYTPPTDLGSTLYSSARINALIDEYVDGDEGMQDAIWSALTGYTYSHEFKHAREMGCRVSNLQRFLRDPRIGKMEKA